MSRNSIYFFLVVIFSLGVAGAGASTAFADNPSVASFIVSQGSMNSGEPVAFSWNLVNASGSSLNFTCPVGIVIKNDAGSVVPCNTHVDMGGSFTGVANYSFFNFNGQVKNIVATLYPKNQNGTDYEVGAVNTTVAVVSAVHPVTDFLLSTTTPASGDSLTLTWTGNDSIGTNLMFNCATNIDISSSGSVATLPCGTPAFSTVQPQSGSVTVTVTNKDFSPVSVIAHLLPAITANTYDATHELSTIFTVKGKSNTPTAIQKSFVSSTNTVVSGAPFTVSWATQNASGVNLQLVCSNETISVSGALCNGFLSPSVFAPTGTSTLTVTNKSYYQQTLSIILLSQEQSGAYTAVNAQTLNLTVLPAGVAAPVPAASATTTTISPAVATPAQTPVTTPAPQAAKTGHTAFSVALFRGSRGAQVSALQTYLAQFPSIYPEGLTTGYFGAATEKAVGRFQEKYTLAKQGDPAYGFVGPKTRTKLNILQ